MFEQISKLIAVLNEVGTLRNRQVMTALTDVACSLTDIDYRSHMLGELSVNLAKLREFDEAEKLARLVQSSEKSEFLRCVAEIEGELGQVVRALPLFSEAREAAFLHRFPAQQAMALAEIAVSLEGIKRQTEGGETWDSAVQLALKAQRDGGTDGSEAAGVLLRAVEAFCREGRIDAAKAVADAIIFESLREKALRTIADSAPQ